MQSDKWLRLGDWRRGAAGTERRGVTDRPPEERAETAATSSSPTSSHPLQAHPNKLGTDLPQAGVGETAETSRPDSLGDWTDRPPAIATETADTSSASPSSSTPSLPPLLMTHVNDYLHGLSQIKYHYKPGRDLPVWSHASKRDRAHVAVLDGLALLLVFSPKGDVAATSYWRTANEFKLFWAKNQPVDDPRQLQYIEDLLKGVRHSGIGDLLKMVIDMCKEKIFHRIQKLAKSFGVSQSNQRTNDYNLWQFDNTKQPYLDLDAKLRTSGLVCEKSTIQVLDDTTREIGCITKTSETTAFGEILFFSSIVTSVASLNEVLSADQVKYLAKLGDYVRVLRQLPKQLKKVGKSKIIIEQVRPPAAKPTEVVSGSLDVLNIRCDQIEAVEIEKIADWDLVTTTIENAQPGQPASGTKTVTFRQHCELTLALHMLELHLQPPATKSKIEIGVSKACCEWCYQYLLLLNSRRKGSVFVRATHGKQPDGWMIPPKGPLSINKEISRLIESRMDDFIWKIHDCRRSDSNPLPESSESDSDEEDDKQFFDKMRMFVPRTAG